MLSDNGDIPTIENPNNFLTPKAKELFIQQCQNIISEIMKLENAFFFFRPVHPEQDKAPDYYQVVVKPMCIFTIQEKLENGQYNDPSEFIRDMRLIFYNAQHYNSSTHLVYHAAEAISQKFEILAATLPHFVKDNELNSGFQREVELRFARYRMNKKTHL